MIEYLPKNRFNFFIFVLSPQPIQVNQVHAKFPLTYKHKFKNKEICWKYTNKKLYAKPYMSTKVHNRFHELDKFCLLTRGRYFFENYSNPFAFVIADYFVFRRVKVCYPLGLYIFNNKSVACCTYV